MVELDVSRNSTTIINTQNDDFIELIITDCFVAQALSKLIRLQYCVS